MLSIILYGRNDDHGYNYHKRLAISLNCLAELLSDPDDEIIFVDYNSPDELPTIIEAIQDTLTEKTKKLIKIFRVRSYHHSKIKTHLSVLEPVARNVAIRRSNPKNKWVLSTNIDMVFVPHENMNLTEIVASLEDGFYSLPRFELPENLWEFSLKRLDPEWNISFLREQCQKLHLNTVVRKEGFLQYDNPGDFQLMLRKDIFEMRGFDEEMLKGWHVDSNLAKRMSLLKKTGGSLESVLSGYHCNHTRKETVLHSKSRTENDWNRFVNNDAILPIANGPNWGLASELIEEVSLGSSTHFTSVAKILGKFPEKNYEILNDVHLYNKMTYSTPRIFAYLADHLSNAPKSMNVAYLGNNLELVQMIESYLELNQFSGKLIRTPNPSTSLVIFDFGFDENSFLGQDINSSLEGRARGKALLKKMIDCFIEIISRNKSINPDTKVIGININYTDYNVLFLRHLSMRLTSYITGSSYGYFPFKRNFNRVFPSIKKKMVFNIRYLLVRYFNQYTDRIRSFVGRR